ncbi:MAG: hypothetical protein KAW93_07755 [Methanogenium sp.]|nr:hypothetical protein [Methanogenium sp.]
MTDKDQINPEKMTREELISECFVLIGRLEKKISGRYRPNENEALYLQSVRAITGLIDTTNRLLKDTELERLDERLQALEQGGNE